MTAKLDVLLLTKNPEFSFILAFKQLHYNDWDTCLFPPLNYGPGTKQMFLMNA